MKINAKKFSNEEITVTYDPIVCTLSCKCAKELSEVFMNSVIPWVDLNGASTDRIKQQVKRCPSGALKFHLKKKLELSLVSK
ncbi:(4Fe-4S)-binding protein [Flavisericum labens]|uniref:(4Fe-4S)-binding protein n=1 Tax=Flavisericum labens TaxID=3377112 RepID=UPI00387B7BDF